MKIIVPMAGIGSRLRPHTLTVPKPLTVIAGKPIVQRLVEDIASVIEEEIEEIEEPPPEEEEPPPPPEIPQPQLQQTQTMEMDLSVPNIDIPMSLSGTPYLGDFAKSRKKGSIGRPARPKIDTNVVPTLRIPPVYPSRALRSGIEGVVTVEFTIGVDGSVKDPEIVKAKPPKIFDKAVLKAITRWKFNPDMVNGKPVEKRARQDVKFKLRR